MDSASEPQHLSKALAELIALRGLARVRGDEQLKSIWKEIAGERIGSHTRVLNVRRGVLEIAVNNAALLNELVAFHKLSLLSALKRQHGELKIRDLKFRLKGDSGG